MALNLIGQPLVDRSDFAHLQAQGVFAQWQEMAVQMHRDGYCLLHLHNQEHLEAIESVVSDMASEFADPLKQWEAGAIGSPRLQDGWKEYQSIRKLALSPVVLDLLESLYGRKPFAFQTLNFAVGSEQHYHSDAVHFSSYPMGFMCGVWFALQTIELNSGPLHYFPGSHRLPYLSARDLDLSPEQVKAEQHPQVLFEPHWEEAVVTHGLRRETFLAQAGDVFVWHANLLHGGDVVNDRTLRRWSQVVHYFFDDCLYTTPMQNFRFDQGGDFVRNPLDIATGKERYGPAEWQKLGLVGRQA